MIRLLVSFRDPGEPMVGRDLIEAVLDATPEMTWQCTREEAASRVFRETEEVERVEVEARDSSGALVGYITATDDDDPNVGPILGIQSFFVLPEHRGPVGRSLLREIVKVARGCRYEIIGFTRRVGEGRFELNYMRLSAREA